MEVPGFEHCEKTAESGFVSYWQAYQRSLDRQVTLMILRPDAVADPDVRQAFLRDIRIMASLKHPALFQVYDVVELDAALAVVMEHLTGTPLRHYVRQRGHAEEPKALTIARWVAEGLCFVYEKTGLVHRVLTPDQVWIDADGQVKMVGLGFHAIVEKIGYSAADLPFLAPELIRRRDDPDYRADLYALGALLYFMVTGRAPFEGYSAEQMISLAVKGQVPAPMTLTDGSSMAFNQFLARMMMKEPAHRYAGWRTAMQEMDKVLDGAKFLLSGRKVGGISTILMPLSGAPARGAGTGAASSPGARAAAPRPADARPGAGLVTAGALLLVAAFWGWTGWRLWRLPPPALDPPRPPTVRTSAPVPVPTPAPSAGEIGGDQRPAARVRVVRRMPSEPAPLPAEPDSAPPAFAEADRFDGLTDQLVAHLATGACARAMVLLDQAVRAPEWADDTVRLENLRRLLARGGNPEFLVAEGLRQHTGRKISLHLSGRLTETTVNRVEGAVVVLTEDTLSGSLSMQKHVRLPVSAIALSDQVRLMAAGNGPEYVLARMLLYVKGGARPRAQALVDQVGDLGPAFRRYLEGLP